MAGTRTTPKFPGPIPAEALAYLREKRLQPSFDHQDVWREEHDAAFAIAKAMNTDVLATVKAALDRALRDGVPFEQFRRDLTPVLQTLGWWGVQELEDPTTGERRAVQLGSPRRLATIFDANVRVARAVGQWDRIQVVKKVRPYLVYELGPSAHHRPQHAAWAGTILPVDDPFWDVAFPPNGWGCNCHVRQISRVEMERSGGVSQRPELQMVSWVNKRTGETLQVPDGIDPGWDRNPGKQRFPPGGP